MSCLQTIVAFLVSIPILAYIAPKFIKYLRGVFFARFNNRLIDQFFEELKDQKKRLFGKLHEIAGDHRPLKVLEFGAGGGANFSFLPKNTEIICVEPNLSSKKYLLARAAKFPELKVKFQLGEAENLSFIESESLDAVIGTHVLCSVTDVDQCVAEILRVLKKGGKYLFLEHIVTEDGHHSHHSHHFFRNPLHFFLHFFCHRRSLTRCTYSNIEKAGFSKMDLEMFTCDLKASSHSLFPFPRHHCAGVAIK